MNLQEKRAALARKECDLTDETFGRKISEIQKDIDRLNRWIDYPMKKFMADVRSCFKEAARISFKK